MNVLQMQTIGKDISSMIQSFCVCYLGPGVCINLPFLTHSFKRFKSRAGSCLKIPLWRGKKTFQSCSCFEKAQWEADKAKPCCFECLYVQTQHQVLIWACVKQQMKGNTLKANHTVQHPLGSWWQDAYLVSCSLKWEELKRMCFNTVSEGGNIKSLSRTASNSHISMWFCRHL